MEAAYFSGRGTLTCTKLDAATRYEIKGSDALCHPRRMVLFWRHLDDAVPQPNIFGARRRRGQEHFGGRRMAVLFEEVVLGDEDVVMPELIGELDLLQRFVVYLEFVLVVPLVGVEWFGRLQLEINAEFHALLSLLKAHVSTRAQVAWMWMYATYTCNCGCCQLGDEIPGCSMDAFLSGLWHNNVSISSSIKLGFISTRKLPSHDRYLQRHRKTRS